MYAVFMGRIIVEYCQWSISDSTLLSVCMYECSHVQDLKVYVYMCMCVLTFVPQ